MDVTGSGGVDLCVLLWANEGCEAGLVEYEDRVLALLGDHGATVLSRARTSGAPGEPLEIHLLQFPSQEAFDAYLADPRRVALAGDRERVVARTEMFNVRLT